MSCQRRTGGSTPAARDTLRHPAATVKIHDPRSNVTIPSQFTFPPPNSSAARVVVPMPLMLW